MNVRIATPKELEARGYLPIITNGEIAYVRTLSNGKQIGVRQATIAELAGVTWDWESFEHQRDYFGMSSRQFKNPVPGKWVMEDMVVSIMESPVPPQESLPHLCHCPSRELLIRGCKCGGL